VLYPNALQSDNEDIFKIPPASQGTQQAQRSVCVFRIPLAEPTFCNELQTRFVVDLLGDIILKQSFKPQWPLAEAPQVGAAAAVAAAAAAASVLTLYRATSMRYEGSCSEQDNKLLE